MNGDGARPRISRKKSGAKYRTTRLESAEYMGIDWGKEDVGVALADAETRIAYAHTTLKNRENLVETLGALIAEKGVKTVVIGIPSRINREEVIYDGERLGDVLRARFGIAVEYQNEMFSTKIAHRNLIERGIRAIERYDDQEAARIILQDWMVGICEKN